MEEVGGFIKPNESFSHSNCGKVSIIDALTDIYITIIVMEALYLVAATEGITPRGRSIITFP